MAQSGDMNCDGALNIADIPLFVDALVDTGSFGGCDISRADMNGDTLINGHDTQPFVAALLAGPCPGGSTLCNGVCVNLLWNSQNCGSCGNACPEGLVCQNGSCAPCTGGLTYCWGICRDILNDPNFCGTTCENAVYCGEFYVCVGGQCQPADPPCTDCGP
jgi:hypothetical protein